MADSESNTRTVTDLCVSSADSSFVFGPVERAEWLVSTPGRIICTADSKLAQSLEPTMRLREPTVHITLDSDGQMYHGNARLLSLEPRIEFEIVDELVPA